MFRAILELIVTIVVVMVARAILSGFLKGVSNAAQGGFRSAQTSSEDAPRTGNPAKPNEGRVGANPSANPGGELHKDPVCGTYVSESTKYQRQTGGQKFFYCSEECREKHSLVAR